MGKKILFVDDDQHWRLVVETSLNDAGYHVVSVSNAGDAILQLEEARPDLIILDLDLGGENGLMLMKFLRQHLPEVPVLLYTGMEHDHQFVQRMLQQGAQQYLRKGGPGELLRAVEVSVKQASDPG